MEQGNIQSIGKTLDTLLVEFDQQAFKDYLSSSSEALTTFLKWLGSRVMSSLLPKYEMVALL